MRQVFRFKPISSCFYRAIVMFLIYLCLYLRMYSTKFLNNLEILKSEVKYITIFGDHLDRSGRAGSLREERSDLSS